jgi:hypothetical protein
MYQSTTNTVDRSAQWSELLNSAVTKPGLLLAAYSAFHGYSISNQVLAMVQCEQRGITPGPIATFPGWKDKGRFVKKGEKALTLCQPISFKDKADPDLRHLGFMFKNRWFVLAQTEGQDVEPVTTPEWSRERAIAALGVEQIPFDHTDGNVQGFARKRTFAISPIAALPHKTEFHELGHIILGHTEESDFSDEVTTPRNLREAEAEGVAMILCETLELPGADYARGYIQNWLQGGTIPEKSAQKIFGAADRILRAGQPQAEREAA